MKAYDANGNEIKCEENPDLETVTIPSFSVGEWLPPTIAFIKDSKEGKVIMGIKREDDKVTHEWDIDKGEWVEVSDETA